MSPTPSGNPPSRRLVITVHGIRTFGQWQERLEELVKERDPAVDVHNYKYGYFSVFAFVVPFLRWLVTRRFRTALARVASDGHWDRIDIVAHSFGTHLVGWGLYGLRRDQRPTIHTIILAGSVLKPGFPWKDLVGDCVQRVVNECGIRDNVLLLNQLTVLFTGMAGREGFNGMTARNFRNRYFDFGHSDYFRKGGRDSNQFMEAHWLPLLLEDGEISAFPDPRTPTVWRGFVTFLLSNAEPVKLALWLIPLLLLVGYIQDRRLEAEEGRRAAQKSLADSFVALGDARLSGREYGLAFARYYEALTLLDELEAESIPLSIVVWQHLRNGWLPWSPHGAAARDQWSVSPGPAELAIWNLLRSWQLPLNTLPLRAALDRPHLIASAGGGDKVLTLGDQGVEVWNTRTGELEGRNSACEADVSSMALSSTGTMALLGTEKGELISCPVPGNGEEWRTRAHTGAVAALAPDWGRDRIVTGGADGTLAMWDMEGRQPSAAVEITSEGAVAHLSFSADAEVVLATSASGLVRLLDARALAPLASFSDEGYAGIGAVFRSDGRIVTQGPRGFALWAWNRGASEPERVAAIVSPSRDRLAFDDVGVVMGLSDAHGGRVRLSPGGTYAISELQEPVMVAAREQRDFETLEVYRLAFWEGNPEPQQPSLVYSLPGLATQTVAADFSDNDDILITAQYGALNVWELAPVRRPREHFSNRLGQTTPAFSQDGRMIAASMSGGDGQIEILDAQTGTVLKRLSLPDGLPRVLTWSESDGVLLAGNDAGLIAIFDVLSGELERAFPAHSQPVQALATTGEEGGFVSVDTGGHFRVWAAESRSPVAEFGCGANGENPATLSLDARLAAAACDGDVVVWDTRSQKEIARPGQGGLPTLAFSADGRRLVFQTLDNTLRVVDISLGDSAISLIGGGSFVAGLGFIMDGGFLVSAGADRQFRVWDLDAERQLLGIAIHHEGGFPLAVSPTGRQVLSNGAYGQILLWDFSGTRELVGRLADPSNGTRNASPLLGKGLWYLARERCDWAIAIFDGKPELVDGVKRREDLAQCYRREGQILTALRIFEEELASGRIPETYGRLWVDALQNAR